VGTFTYKIIPAPHVTSTSGTGLVHCAPAHGPDDYAAFKALSLLSSSSMICHVGLDGKFTPDILGIVGEEHSKKLVGVEVLKGGSEAMLSVLRDMNAVSFLHEEKIKHRYPYDWKTGEPTIILCACFHFVGTGTDSVHVSEQRNNGLLTLAPSRRRLLMC
jgi:isoleucyl-tRNA synthetase